MLVYFARDIAHLIAVWFRGLRSPEARAHPDYRLAWLVIIGTIPIAVLGVLFKHGIETVARNLWLIATTMVVFGVLLGLAEYYGRQRVDLQQLKVTDGVVLGLAQACALIPGVSRSGGTITAGLFLGLKREAAVRYSFLLAIPAVVAAGVFTIPDIAKGGITPVQMIVATVIAFIVGFAMIAWLLRWVAKHTGVRVRLVPHRARRAAVRGARGGLGVRDLALVAPDERRLQAGQLHRQVPEPSGGRGVAGGAGGCLAHRRPDLDLRRR